MAILDRYSPQYPVNPGHIVLYYNRKQKLTPDTERGSAVSYGDLRDMPIHPGQTRQCRMGPCHSNSILILSFCEGRRVKRLSWPSAASADIVWMKGMWHCLRDEA